MRRSASEIIRNLETRIARLERKASTNRRATRYGRVITKAIDLIKRKYSKTSESMIAEKVIETVHALYENLHETIRSTDEDEYIEYYVELYPKLVNAGIIGDEQYTHNTSRKLRDLREVDLLAEEMYEAKDLAEYTIDMYSDMFR